MERQTRVIPTRESIAGRECWGIGAGLQRSRTRTSATSLLPPARCRADLPDRYLGGVLPGLLSARPRRITLKATPPRRSSRPHPRVARRSSLPSSVSTKKMAPRPLWSLAFPSKSSG
ncbi:hypothetical protein SETIT_1G331200v2 [Setaria italica]|uniref:Uncharacterized protein n=1 Tax=Setaria italica TaxID=4555 RepID=A0A368PRT8_SETIT|nr:hypothetical protein SETIT_1G331200v2 [Setaria italica]